MKEDNEDNSNKDQAKKIQESIERLLNTKTNLKRKRKSQIQLQKQLFTDIINGIIELTSLNKRLGEEGIFLDSYYNLSFSIIEFALEMFLGRDLVTLIVYYLENLEKGTPQEIVYGEDDKPLEIKNIDQLWDMILKIRPDLAEEK